MGVHDVHKYEEVRIALGIPEGEPLFIIRAQDRLAAEIVSHYRRIYTQAAMIEGIPIPEIDRFVANMDEALAEFLEWRKQNKASVKFPD